MSSININRIAESLGLTIETVIVPERERAYRVFKGAKLIFVGTEKAVAEFLSTYEQQRPGLYEGSMYDYRD
jgi:hypothetical protein